MFGIYFITEEMVLSIVNFTNKRIENTILKVSDLLQTSNKYPHIKVTDKIEIEAYFGLLYFRGLFKLNMHLTNIIFSERHGLPVFGAAVSRMRF